MTIRDDSEAKLEQATALLAVVCAAPAGTLDDDRLLSRLDTAEHLGRYADALRIAAAAEVAERSRHELGAAGLSYRMGQRYPGHLIEQITRVAPAEAGRRMRLGALVRTRASLDGTPLPPLYSHVATALTLGQIGADAAAFITQNLQQAAGRCAPDDLFEAERCLVDQAREDSADLIGIQARLWRDTLDADGAEPRDDDLRMRREVRLGRERGGMTPLYGQLDPVGAARFKAMIDSYSAPGCSPRFREESDHYAVDDESLPETRTPGQLACDIMLGVITAGMAADPTAPKSKASIVLTMRADDYLSGTGIAWLSGVQEPISATHAQELACDAEIRLMRLGQHGEILSLGLSLGLSRRLFTPNQRLALTVRDGGCIWPHCTAPPAWCDAHHAIAWSRGGPTDVNNGVLLCPAHHHLLHHSDFELVMHHGIPHLIPPRRLNPTGREWRVGRSRITTVLKR
ncbi:MAG: hypothetical protein QOJ18_1055 [Microbacteriaceae bacterium]|nr:hypothetical protein [Microbacteriaceae bacterium]